MPNQARRLFGGLTFRLLLLAGLPLFVVALVGYIFYDINVQPRIQQNTLQELQNANHADTEHMEAQIQKELELLRYLALRPEAISMDTEAFLPELERIIASFPGLGALVLADRDGNVLLDSNRRRGGGNVADQTYFRSAILGSPVISDIVQTRTRGHSVAIIAHPVVSPSGAYSGVLFGTFDSTYLYESLHRQEGRERIGSFVIDSTNKVVAGLVPGRSIVEEELPREDASRPYVNHHGVTVFGIRTPIEATRWNVVTEIPVTAMTAAYERYNSVLIGSALLSLLFAALAAALVASSIRTPIHQLRELSERIGAGEFQDPVEIPPLLWAPWQLQELQKTMIEMARQIEERKTSLREALEEKSALLREVNHRVRNNLAVIQSLLSLQRRSVPNQSEAETLLRDSQNRIASIAILHDLLYNAGSLARVDLMDYVPQLLEQIQISFGRAEVTVTTRLESIILPPELVIPLGMVLNELVTNAYKHAFPEGGGTIVIELRRIGEEAAEFTVRDDGIGMQPESLPAAGGSGGGQGHPGQVAGVGSELIRELTQQVGGSLVFSQEGGIVVRLRFPVTGIRTMFRDSPS